MGFMAFVSSSVTIGAFYVFFLVFGIFPNMVLPVLIRNIV